MKLAGRKYEPLKYPYVCRVCLGKTGEVRLGEKTYVVVFHRVECPIGIRMRPVRVIVDPARLAGESNGYHQPVTTRA